MSIVRSIVLFIGISLGLSGTAPNVDEDVLAMLPVIAVVGLAFVLVEELAWRGWLQRTAQTRLPVPAAALLVGAVWGLWHAPLHDTPGTAQADIHIVPFLLLTMAFSVPLAWIYNRSAGSVPAVAVVPPTPPGSQPPLTVREPSRR